jgi:hypothetical protein
MQHICNNCWNIFNAILHNPITSHLTFVSWILMFKNKIINFILNHPLDDNLIFRFLNGKKNIVNPFSMWSLQDLSMV